jgi:cystathionine beta-lyase
MTNKFNFDDIIDRSETDSIKYNHARCSKPSGALPLWVADMDFKAPPEALSVVARCAEHGIFGYTEPRASYYEALLRWYKTRFDWAAEQEWVTVVPGIVFALSSIVRACAEEGGAVIICQPVYPHFEHVITANNRKLVVNELLLKNGVYETDFDAFEKQIIQNRVKLFILCSPHNPVGRVWTRGELSRIAQICLKHNVVIAADEIHSDFVYTPHKHTVLASLSPEIADITITCTAPTKTFNLAGLQISNVFISNPKLRAAFRCECAKTGYSNPSLIGTAAAQAAYACGAPWLEELLHYLKANVDCLREGLANTNGLIKLCEPQGTYLMWLDCRAMEMSDAELENFYLNKAGLWLNAGVSFGLGGSGFMRMNIACPRSTVAAALSRLKAVI